MTGRQEARDLVLEVVAQEAEGVARVAWPLDAAGGGHVGGGQVELHEVEGAPVPGVVTGVARRQPADLGPAPPHLVPDRDDVHGGRLAAVQRREALEHVEVVVAVALVDPPAQLEQVQPVVARQAVVAQEQPQLGADAGVGQRGAVGAVDVDGVGVAGVPLAQWVAAGLPVLGEIAGDDHPARRRPPAGPRCAAPPAAARSGRPRR